MDYTYFHNRKTIYASIKLVTPRLVSLTALVFILLTIAGYTCALASDGTTVIAKKKLIYSPPDSGKTSIQLTSIEKKWLKAHPSIRVMGETDYPPWDFTENGRPVGYGIDYVKLLAHRLGLDLEFIIAPYGELIEKTASRELDLMHTAQIGLHDKILTSKSYGAFLQTAFTSMDAGIKKISDLKGKRVAVIKGDAVIQTLRAMAPDAIIEEYPGYLKALIAVNQKEADAAVMDHSVGEYLIRQHLLSGLKSAVIVQAANGDPHQDMRLGVRSDWPELLTLLEKAMDTITDQELEALNQKWLKKLNEHKLEIDFTPSELRWLEAHPVIRVATDPFRQPVEFRDEKGEYHGISIDYLKRIELMLGIQFEFIRGNRQGLITLAKQRQLDMFTSVAETPGKKKYLLFTDPYIQMPVGIFANEGVAYISDLSMISSEKIAVVKNYATHDYFAANHPDINLVLVNNPEEGIRNVIEKKVFAFIGNTITTGHLLSRRGLLHINLVGEIPFVNNLKIGVRKDWPILQNILQKALNTIPESEKNTIYNKWIPITYEKATDFTLVWQIGFGTLTLICLVIFWNRKLSIEVNNRTAELKESETRFKNLVDSSFDGIFIHREFIALELNRQLADMLNEERETLLGQNVTDWVSPGSHKKINDFIQADKENIYQVDMIRADGTVVNTEIFGINCIYQSKEARLVAVRDITAHKQAQDAHLKLITAIEQAAENIVITDHNTVIQYVNPSFEQLTGYTKDEVLGKTPRILQSGRHSKEFYREMWESLEKKNAWKGQLTNKKKDGSLYTEDATITPIIDDNGNITSYISVNRDITEQIKIEKRLQQSQKMEAIGTLAGGIAHDFNNILFPIIGFAELLQEDIPKDSPLQESVTQIFKSSLRARDLVKQILTFSRQDNPELKPVRLQILIKEVVKLLGASIPSTIDIQPEIDPDCGMVVADPTQIHQIIMNLSTNAFHAMQESGGLLKIHLKQTLIGSKHLGFDELKPGEYAVIKIIDTGKGIKKDIKDQIFDPYFTTKPKGKGTGLGLSVVKGIAKSYKGDIHVYSEPGKGTEVHVYLPTIQKLSENEPIHTLHPVKGGAERILLVDDEKAIAGLQQKMLERLGYHVTAHSSSVEALNTFKANPNVFDLLITDMTMPEMTGLKLIQEIKKIRQNIPFIICTGFSDEISDEKCRSLGIECLIAKPIIQRDFLKAIRQVFKD